MVKAEKRGVQRDGIPLAGRCTRRDSVPSEKQSGQRSVSGRAAYVSSGLTGNIMCRSSRGEVILTSRKTLLRSFYYFSVRALPSLVHPPARGIPSLWTPIFCRLRRFFVTPKASNSYNVTNGEPLDKHLNGVNI